MNSTDEASIDAEALQAQIDLSMSFAQNLISSWMQPHNLPKSYRRNDLEKQIKEDLRRPSRLGVGASVPEGQSLTRETARLKRKLSRKKNPEEDDVLNFPDSTSKEDECETRGGATKRKVRHDPFAVNKKKRMQVVGDHQPILVEKSQLTDKRKSDSSSDSEAIANMLMNTCNDLSPEKGKQIEDDVDTSPIRDDSSRINSNTPSKLLPNLKTLNNSNHAEISLFTKQRSGDKHDSDSALPSPSTSPKKKRKRRRKKKHSVTGITVDQITASQESTVYS